MRNLRFYTPALTAGRIQLDPSESHHLIHVLRVKTGTPVELFDGRGNTARAVVSHMRKKEVTVEADAVHHAPPVQPAIILAISIAKGSRFDLAVEKCTELGADHLCAVQFDRTVKLGKQEALDRYQRIAVSAVKQSGRDYLPTLSGPASLPGTIEDLKSIYPDATRLYGDPGPDSIPLNQLPFHDKSRPIICMIGPEGGFTEDEVRLFADNEFRPVQINPNILRTETAAIAFAALLAAFKL